VGGCIVVHDHDDGSPPPAPPPDVAYEAIDAGQALTTDPGTGASILLEYEGGTTWNLVTTCDTLETSYPCSYDIYLRAHSITPSGAIELEGSDFIDQTDGELHVGLDTSLDVDGVRFDTAPGESVEVEVYLDGDSAEPFVFWVGNGETHTGSRTNPTVFVPN